MTMNNRKLLYTLVALIFLSNAGLMAQEEWLVPAHEQGKLCRFSFDEQTINEGEALYMINCKSCHGNPGQGNFSNLKPSPGDPATEKIQQNMDGELYYKIRTGRKLMPSFKNILSPNQTWQVIAYLRSFNSSYLQEIAIVPEGMDVKWEDIEIFLKTSDGSGNIQAMVTGMEETGPSPIPGVEIQLFAKRTFGNLLLSESTTNEEGIAICMPPLDLPGDSEGKVNIIARLSDEEKFGTVLKDTAMTIGIPVTPVSLVEKRAMWNIQSKAPYWILITYLAGVLIVWGLIFFVMVELRSIFKIGQYFENEE
jgi:hypothetical protein